jgi:subtilisin-like proprotein convertase family protein
MHRSVWLLAAVFAVTSVWLAAPALAGAATFSNPATITINDSALCSGGPSPAPGTASPYPSQITVSGLLGSVTDVNATLTGLSHTYPDDVDVLLVGPAGQSTILMADTGGGSDVSGVNLLFSDAAAASLPDEAALASGTYKPTIGTSACSVPASFPLPAPAGPYGSLLSVFNGTNPNGTWSLYVIDDDDDDTGSISGGWSLDITVEPLAVQVTSLRAVRSQKGVIVRWRTGTEVNELGFNIFRQQGNRRVRLNKRVIPALTATRGGVRGGAYSFVDRRAPRHRAVRYWLQDVSVSGARAWHGPVRVAAA